MSQNAFQNERLGTVEPDLTLINASPFTMLRRWFGILTPPTTSGFELEDGSGVILLESGDKLLLEVQ